MNFKTFFYTVITLGAYLIFKRRKKRDLPDAKSKSTTKVNAVPPHPDVSKEIPADTSKRFILSRATKAFTAVFVGGAAITYSPRSEAISAYAIAQATSQKMSSMMSGVFNNFLGGMINMTADQGDKQTAALGKTGDSINETATRIHNQNVLRASEPPPNACDSALLGQQEKEASEEAIIKSAEDNARLADYTSKLSPARTSRSRIRRQRKRAKIYGKGAPREGYDLTPSHLSMTEVDEEGKKDAYSFANNVMGETQYTAVALERVDTDNLSPSDASYLDAHATYTARRSIAMNTQIKSINRRVKHTSEQSEADLEYQEVMRRSGSQEWRDKISGEYADPTPLTKELVHIMATNNRFTLKQIGLLEESNVLLSTILLEMLDSPARKSDIQNKYQSSSTIAGNSDIHNANEEDIA